MSETNQLEDLLAQTALGNRAAFEKLYKQTHQHLYAILIRMLNQQELASDALQEAYVQIWQKASEYRADVAKPMTWMSSIARYRALDMVRAQSRRDKKRDSDVETDTLVDESQLAWQDEYDNAATLEHCMQTLSDDSHQAIKLAYNAGYTHDEIAAKMDKPLGTVKAWIRRGLLKLRDCVEGAESAAC